MHTHVLFEHPLNEKMRTWLRIEFLIQQLSSLLPVHDHTTALHFFRNVGDLLDVLERGEVRTDLVKELERQQRKLQAWAEVPGVDNSRIDSLRQQLKNSSGVLMAAPRIGQFLREDRLVDLLRLQLPLAAQLYPQISGHKSRFAIRFMPLDSEHGLVPERLDFELACC